MKIKLINSNFQLVFFFFFFFFFAFLYAERYCNEVYSRNAFVLFLSFVVFFFFSVQIDRHQTNGYLIFKQINSTRA